MDLWDSQIETNFKYYYLRKAALVESPHTEISKKIKKIKDIKENKKIKDFQGDQGLPRNFKDFQGLSGTFKDFQVLLGLSRIFKYFFLTGTPLKVLNVRLHRKSHQKKF